MTQARPPTVHSRDAGAPPRRRPGPTPAHGRAATTARPQPKDHTVTDPQPEIHPDDQSFIWTPGDLNPQTGEYLDDNDD